MTDDVAARASRVSDADREDLMARLQVALTGGRIDVHEFGSVPTRRPGQLSSLFGDLRLRSLAPGEPTSRWRARVRRGR